MLIASIFAHISLGLLLAIIFVLYYINGASCIIKNVDVEN